MSWHGAASLAELFAAARRRLPDAALVRACGGRGRDYGRFRQLFGLWPVQLVGEDGWQPMPAAGALWHEERLILAVRAGPVDLARIPRLRLEPREPGIWPTSGRPAAGQAGRVRGWRAVFGPEVVDLIALPRAAKRDGLRSLVGGTAALGDPFGDLARLEGPAELEPVPVARNLAGWLRQVMAGAVLPLGEAWAQLAYLRSIAAPLRAEDLAHGRELAGAFRRPERRDLPEIVVAAA